MSLQEYKKIIISDMAYILKPYGFNRKGSNFFKSMNDVILFIQLQSSTSSTKDYLKTTTNLGIYSHSLGNLIGNKGNPTILDSQWNARIGFFLSERHDKWWEAKSIESARQAGTEIITILIDKALPFMESLNSTEKMKVYWESGNYGGLTDYMRAQYLDLLQSHNFS